MESRPWISQALHDLLTTQKRIPTSVLHQLASLKANQHTFCDGSGLDSNMKRAMRTGWKNRMEGPHKHEAPTSSLSHEDDFAQCLPSFLLSTATNLFVSSNHALRILKPSAVTQLEQRCPLSSLGVVNGVADVGRTCAQAN